MEIYGFDPCFPDTVMQEIISLELSHRKENKIDVQILSHLLLLSIDIYDSMYLDQIVFCEAQPCDEILMWITICRCG
mgnify:CR=1 FL=1